MTTGTVAVSAGDKVKKGQVIGKVGTTGASSGPHCHFQIEFNGTKIDPLTFKYNNGMGNGNGGFGVDSKDSEKKEKENKKDKQEDKDVKKATVIQESGDGYTQKYTSSAGITYTEFKQFQGSYSENSYWDGTIHSSGCGPTSVAILMSGLTNKNYTPADTAAEMKSKYGYTSYETLQKEMNDVGLTSEVIQSPSAEQIQNNLRNGKVMLVSVNSATIFTGASHIMALIDINDQGQVYIANPSSTTLNGWWDISDIMKGCQYVVATDAGASGVASSSNTSGYAAVVATWNQVDTTVTTNDPNVKAYSETKYSMTTTDVNYEEMVDPYTMPFDLLWALLVVGEDRQFVFELADLVYNSEIEITVHDNVTTNTDEDAWTYTQKEEAIVSANITANCGGVSATGSVENDKHEKDYPYATTKTVVTQTDTINTALTKANVWIVDYENDYTYVAPTSSTSNSQVTVPDQEYSSTPSKTGDSYSCEHINAKKQELAQKVKQSYNSSNNSTTSGVDYSTSTEQTPPVTYTEDIDVKYYEKYVNMVDNITNIVKNQKYIAGSPSLKEKTDKDTAPNFVTIYNSKKHEINKRNINSAARWLFEIIETNDSTSNVFPELIRYLLYKATGAVYDGIKGFDFGIFYQSQLTSVGADDYVVDTTKSSSDIVITDLETLKRAFAGSGGAGSSNLVQYAADFLEFQNKYNVNAVFAAAVTTAECGAGTNCRIGGNNWFSIKGSGGWRKYPSPRGSIEDFYKLIANGTYYFQAGKYTVKDIGMTYCENADAPGGWIENVTTYMSNMFSAAGINVSSIGGGDFLQVAKKCHDFVRTHNFSYGGGANIPVTENQSVIDCSGYVSWVLYEYGYKDLAGSQQNTRTLYSLAVRKGWTIKSGAEAKPGDILLNPSSHTEIYIGNGKVYNCGSTSAIRAESTNNNPSKFEYSITVTKP